MKEKKQKKKVIPHCYRRNLSRTLSNRTLSTSQLVQIGSYKKHIHDLSRNNRKLASALQEARVEAAIQNNFLQECAKDCNKILFARLKLNEMAKNLAKFVTDLEEVRSYLNVDVLVELNNPFAHKKGSLNGRICKEPAVNCIEEVSEEISACEIAASENSPTAPGVVADLSSNDRKSNFLPSDLGNNAELISEDIEMAPILFADDSGGKKKKSSNKCRSSKFSNDADKASLTPELNIDLTNVKTKRKSSRRHTQFLFPGSRSTSRGKATEKENSLDESVTPPKPSSPIFTHQEEEVTGIEETNQENSASPIKNNVRAKDVQRNFPENQSKPALESTKCDRPNVSIVKPAKSCKTVVAPEIQPGESNHTVLLCEDMELTEVIRPEYQIIIENTPLPAFNSLENAKPNCDNTKKIKEKKNEFDIELISEKSNLVETKEDDIYDKLISEKDSLIKTKGDDIYKKLMSEKDSLVETKRNGIHEEFMSETDSLDLFKVYPSKRNDDDEDDDIEIPEINEDDEVQNVGMITFCESKDDDDKNISNRSTKSKSSLMKQTRRAKPVKYAVYFSSDESEEDSPFEISTNKRKNSKRQTVIATKVVKPCKTNENIDSHRKTSTDESKTIENDVLGLLHSEKEAKLGKKSLKKSKDLKSSSKKDLNKQKSKISLTASKDKHVKPGENDNNIKLTFSPISSPGILKKKLFNIQTTKKIDKESHVGQIAYNDNLDDVIESVIDTPKSESRKVSFAPTDLVCNFRRMSVSKKIAENKKVRRASKSFLDLEELFEEEDKTKTSCVGADNFSESTDVEKENDQVSFNFSGETELYTIPVQSSDNFSSAAVAVDDLSINAIASLNATQKNVNKNNKHLKKVVSSKPVKASGKLSLKKNKDLKNTDQTHISSEICKEINASLFESPMSVCKPPKRKSLFKEHLADEAKENVHVDQLVLEKLKVISQEKDEADTNKDLALSAQENCVKKKSKSHSNVNGKISTKKLSDKQKLLEPTSNMKKKKHSVAVKYNENSPVLKDTVNLPEVQDGNMVSKRRSKQVSYKEPNLNKKLRRE